jgi:hypothetical protein
MCIESVLDSSLAFICHCEYLAASALTIVIPSRCGRDFKDALRFIICKNSTC